MWKRRQVKKNARGALRRNFFQSVLVCLIIAFVISGPFSISQTVQDDLKIMEDVAKNSPSPKLNSAITKSVDAVTSFQKATSIGDDSKAGVISNIYTKVQKSGGVIMSVVHSVNKSIFNDKLSNDISGALGIVLAGILYIFIGGALEIGRARFFLENRLYTESSSTEILHVYRIKRTLRAAAVVFIKTIFLLLWALTIVGFPIKYYSYYLVENLFAENPDISHKDILKLSSRMMKGSRWKVFILDLSFIYWHILSVASFGILKYVYLDP
jgi:hypothetical protein